MAGFTALASALLWYILPPTADAAGFDLVSQSTYQYMHSHKELEALEDFIRKSPTSKPEVQYKFVTFSIHGAHSGARRAASGETLYLHLHQESSFD